MLKEKSDIAEGVGAVNLQLLESLLEGQLLGSTRTHLERRKDSLWSSNTIIRIFLLFR
jgi:hypothetical protein